MKTTLNQVLAPGQSGTLQLLDWSDSAALPARQRLTRKSPTRTRIPALRIVRQVAEKDSLFEHAIRASKRSAFWEAFVFGSLAASGLAAIVWSFFGG